MPNAFLGYPSCEKCSKKLTEDLTKEQEEGLVGAIIGALKKYPISYAEAHRVLGCVTAKLETMSQNLQL